MQNAEEMDPELARLSDAELRQRIQAISTEERGIASQVQLTKYEITNMKHLIDDNTEKIKLNKQLPYLVGNIVEILDLEDAEDADTDMTNVDSHSMSKKGVVLKTTTRQHIFLPVIGLVDPDDVQPSDMVGINKDTHLILEKLPNDYDTSVKAMEVTEKPTDDYADIGGLSKQIEELIEAVVLPMTRADLFTSVGIQAPKGVLLFGPPGTGKTMMARACAAQTDATFLKLAGPQLVQKYIGIGSRLIRDAFKLAKSKAPAIIFIDELDAIGTKRFDSETNGDREVQRTMLELLNQMDGFSSTDDVKVIAATNRVDILDPALLRSGRFDRKIEFQLPNEAAREQILAIHSRRMTVAEDVDYEQLARSTDDFNGAQLKATCVEAGMLALRRDSKEVRHQDFVDGIGEVITKKKTDLTYYT